MSSPALVSRPALPARPARWRCVVPAPALAPRLVAFAALSSFAAWHYAGLVIGAPAGRVAAVVTASTIGGAAIAWTAGQAGRATVALRLALAAGCAYVGFLVIGVPVRLLWPWHWLSLAHDVNRGFAGLAAELWPYRGHDRWATLTVLLGLPACLVPAATLAFWPSTRGETARRTAAPAILVALSVVGTVNVPPPHWTLDGTALLALVATWLWLPSVRRADAGRALAWVAACGALALAVAPALRADRPLLDYSSWNPFGLSQTGVFQWDQLYGPITWPRSREVMFEVAAPAPQLWKVTTLDRFDGVRFLRSDTPPSTSGVNLGTPVNPRWYEQTTVTIKGLRSDLVVGAGQVVDLTMRHVQAPTVATAQPDGTTSLASALHSGESYTVMSYVPHPSPAQLRRAPRRFPRDYLPYTSFDLPGPQQSGLANVDLPAAAHTPYFTPRTVGTWAPGLPLTAGGTTAQLVLASPYARMYKLARRLAAGQPTTYDVVNRIATYLRRVYAYNEHPPRRRYPLDAFLFQDGIGYCQQFSGAMALMLRMDGIPARVAAGFLPGAYDPATKLYEVRAVDAHAWVEVYFGHIGWVPFDPTPPRTLLTTQTASLVSPNEGISLSLATIGARQVVHRHERLAGTQRSTPTAHGRSIAWLVAAGLAVVLLAGLGVLWLSGRARLRRGLSGDAEGAVSELRDALERMGYGVSGPTTLAVLERRLDRAGGPMASRYVRLLRERRFAPGAVEGPGPGDRRALRRALTPPGAPLVWVRGLLALPPGAARRTRPEA